MNKFKGQSLNTLAFFLKGSLMIDPNMLFGLYELAKIETYKDGILKNEKAKAGRFLFGSDYKLMVVNSSSEKSIGYTGTYEIKDSSLIIHVEASCPKEMEDFSIKRDIFHLDEKKLILISEGKDGVRSLISWNKVYVL